MVKIFKTKVNSDGQVTIPAEILMELGIKVGQGFTLTLKNRIIEISSPEAALDRIQKKIGRFVPENVSLGDEIIAECRRESESDE